MDSVFLLWHSHQHTNGTDDDKLIGVYSTKEKAQASLQRMRSVEGFRDYPEGFEIAEYFVDRDEWVEGFVTATWTE